MLKVFLASSGGASLMGWFLEQSRAVPSCGAMTTFPRLHNCSAFSVPYQRISTFLVISTWICLCTVRKLIFPSLLSYRRMEYWTENFVTVHSSHIQESSSLHSSSFSLTRSQRNQRSTFGWCCNKCTCSMFTQLSGFAFCTCWKGARRLREVFWRWSLPWVLFADPGGVYLSGCPPAAYSIQAIFCMDVFFSSLRLCLPVSKKKITISLFLSTEGRLRDSTAHCFYYSRQWLHTSINRSSFKSGECQW